MCRCEAVNEPAHDAQLADFVAQLLRTPAQRTAVNRAPTPAKLLHRLRANRRPGLAEPRHVRW